MVRNLNAGRKYAVLFFSIAAAALVVVINSRSMWVQSGGMLFLVLFASIGTVEWVDYRKRTRLDIAEREQTIELKTQKMLDEETSARLFREVRELILAFKELTQDEQDRFLMAFPILFDFYDLKYREHVYTMTQARLVLLNNGKDNKLSLTKRYGRWYLPVIHGQDSYTRIWLTALTNDMINAGCANRDHPNETAYLLDEPEACFLKLYPTKGENE